MNIFKLIFLVAIPLILFISSYAGYRYASIKGLYEPTSTSAFTYQQYSLNKTEHWQKRFDFVDSQDYNSIKRTIVGTRENFLEVRRGWQTYLIQYDTEIDVELISWVREVREQGDSSIYPSRYFLVQYERFVEIVRFNPTLSTTPLSPQVNNGTYEAEICLQLPIESTSNARYHVDSKGNIWIVTASMNKVVFIQVYSCIEGRLVAEFRHILEDGQNVNEVMKIVKKGDGDCMGIEVVTYGLNVVQLEVCPYRQEKSIVQRSDYRRSHHIKYEQVEVKDYEVLQGYTQAIQQQQWKRILKYILNFLTFSPDSSLLYDRKSSLDQNKKQPFDSLTIDQQNNYLISFSQNTSSTSILSLAPYLINSKNPLFHNNPNYHKHDVLKMLDRQYRKEYNPDIEHRTIIPGLNQTRKATYKAAYRIYPDTKVEYLGLTSKVIVFWPQDKLDQKDYSFIRTHEGGLVSQGNKFKGSFDKVPVQYEEVYQRVDAKPQEVLPGIYEAHVGYFNLMTYLVRSKEDDGFVRVELMNMLGGRPVLTHYLSLKEGYRYVSTTLLNNQWWILEYSPSKKASIATKYELYANASAPSTLLNIKRVYGTIGSEQHLNGEDDLAELMQNFIQKHGNGFLLLSVYRCIDEYYYLEYTDIQGSVFGVARIHFKNFSNRRVKKSRKYSGQFQRLMLVDEKDMIPQRYSRKPYSVFFKNVDIFKHVPQFLEKNDGKKTWHQYCTHQEKGRTFRKLQKLGGFHYFPISHYAIGNYGCEFSSDRPHPQSYSVFNLRSIIIDGKEAVQDRGEVRRQILKTIFLACGGYIVLALIILLGGLFKKKEKGVAENTKKGKEKKN